MAVRLVAEPHSVHLASGKQYSRPDGSLMILVVTASFSKFLCHPVQGFATADLLPIALVRLDKQMRKLKMKSVICNTVHDSIVLDVHPDEKDQAIKVLSEAMLSLPQETKRRYGIEYNMPVGIELKMGKNWLDLEEVSL